jgi:hypothetical protein
VNVTAFGRSVMNFGNCQAGDGAILTLLQPRWTFALVGLAPPTAMTMLHC